jgi:hypothetical protein
LRKSLEIPTSQGKRAIGCLTTEFKNDSLIFAQRKWVDSFLNEGGVPIGLPGDVEDFKDFVRALE